MVITCYPDRTTGDAAKLDEFSLYFRVSRDIIARFQPFSFGLSMCPGCSLLRRSSPTGFSGGNLLALDPRFFHPVGKVHLIIRDGIPFRGNRPGDNVCLWTFQDLLVEDAPSVTWPPALGQGIASSANVIVFKDLGMLQLEFDRPELNRLATQAKEAFAGVKGDRRRWAFVYAPDTDFLGLLKNDLPTFWKPSLSHLFAAGSAPSPPRSAKRLTPQEKAQKAREMRAQGASYGEIGRALGVRSRSTVQNYIVGYPYRRRPQE